MFQTGPSSAGRYFALALAATLLACAASESALARGRGGHSAHRHSGGSRVAIGLILAAPMYRYFPAPIYAPVIAPASPPVYIERGDAQPGPSTGDWWYYCADSKAYYPYVKECAREWQPVAAEPRTGQ